MHYIKGNLLSCVQIFSLIIFTELANKIKLILLNRTQIIKQVLFEALELFQVGHIEIASKLFALFLLKNFGLSELGFRQPLNLLADGHLIGCVQRWNIFCAFGHLRFVSWHSLYLVISSFDKSLFSKVTLCIERGIRIFAVYSSFLVHVLIDSLFYNIGFIIFVITVVYILIFLENSLLEVNLLSLNLFWIFYRRFYLFEILSSFDSEGYQLWLAVDLMWGAHYCVWWPFIWEHRVGFEADNWSLPIRHHEDSLLH